MMLELYALLTQAVKSPLRDGFRVVVITGESPSSISEMEQGLFKLLLAMKLSLVRSEQSGACK
jgi:hypothetical protein